MIIGIGMDIIELSRVERLHKEKRSFAKRVLTEEERKMLDRLHGKRQVEFLAGRFAAKEAYAKAKGCGIGKELSFQDLELGNGVMGKPVLYDMKENIGHVHVSITHTRTMAAAQVVVESEKEGRE